MVLLGLAMGAALASEGPRWDWEGAQRQVQLLLESKGW